MNHSSPSFYLHFAFVLRTVVASVVNVSAAGTATRQTRVSIVADQFFINNQPTCAGRVWEGHRNEGLLFNTRMAQGIYDDLNPATGGRWAYPDTGKWDTDRNTREFVAAMPQWKAFFQRIVKITGAAPAAVSAK